MKEFENKKIILFDGVCNLCNGAINFIIDHDDEGIHSFASLQSDFGKKVLKHFGLPQDQYESFLLIDNGILYDKSSAALRIAKNLPKFSWFYYFIYIPKFLRDAVYSLVAKNRYRFFGKTDACRIPTPELLGRFL